MQAYTSTPVKSTAHRDLQAARMDQSNSQSEDMDHSGYFSYQDDQLDITYLPHDDSSHSADESSGGEMRTIQSSTKSMLFSWTIC